MQVLKCSEKSVPAIFPLTPERWSAMEDLFGAGGACGKCWCMYWRIGSAYRKRAPEENMRDFHAVVEAGPPPGLVAFAADSAIGWCQVTPQNALPAMAKAKEIGPADDMGIWSLSCIYVRKGWRRKGVARALVEAAVEFARDFGAPALEAYPLDAKLTNSASFTGFVSTFERAGFEIVSRKFPARPVMRIYFDGSIKRK